MFLSYLKEVNQNQFNALVSLAYNIGMDLQKAPF
jgi:GH24 family phage-related lysozyme (muramidase)